MKEIIFDKLDEIDAITHTNRDLIDIIYGYCNNTVLNSEEVYKIKSIIKIIKDNQHDTVICLQDFYNIFSKELLLKN